MATLVDDLRNLNCSNTMDTPAHTWGALMNVLADALDPECDADTLTRRLKREGLAGKPELVQTVESVIERRIVAMKALLEKLEGLE